MVNSNRKVGLDGLHVCLFCSLYGAQFTLLTHLIKPNYLKKCQMNIPGHLAQNMVDEKHRVGSGRVRSGRVG